jgi:hypothetical protein
MSGRKAKEVPHADARSSQARCPQECECKTNCRRYAVVLRGGLHAVRLHLCRSGLLTRTQVVVVPDVLRRVRCGTHLFVDGGDNDQ